MKVKSCKSCRSDFVPVRPQLQRVCSASCAIAIVKVKQAQRAAKQQRQDKQRIKTKAKWLQEAQTEFNKFIRLRDAGHPCISCQKPPKKANAGHYKTTKAYPELRFNEDGCHIQCEHCNTYLSGNISAYRVNLIAKIGIERVEWLESKHETKHYSIDDIKAIKTLYREKCRNINANL
jgi:hypothetical protein